MTTITNKSTAYTFIRTLEGYAKRSKHITMVHKYVGCELCAVQVNITKDTKATRAMVEYIASVLPYAEVEDTGSTWYKSYAEEPVEDVWMGQCCVSRH